ncbi:MAG: hypothetical protein ABR563_14050, partial [Pyrinomonadaceae bacterium]
MKTDLRVPKLLARGPAAVALLCVSLLALAGPACRHNGAGEDDSAGAGKNVPTLTHVEEFAKLPQEELKRGHPVSLRAVVTY